MATTIQFINGFYTGNNYLTQSQKDKNAMWIFTYLRAVSKPNWAKESIYALLGNMDIESTVNPGLWESRTVNYSRGFGLVQWTPASKYIDWCNARNITPAYMDSNLQRIQWEILSGESDQWIPLSEFDRISFEEFAENSEGYGIKTLTRCFMKCYERPADYGEKLEQRQAAAQHYRDLIDDGYIPPDVPIDPDVPTAGGQYWFANKWFIYLRKNRRYRK